MNLLLSVLVGFMGLTAEGDTTKRPIDPWVFYAGYDEAPGRLFVALHKNMWLVYDTTHANLYRTFKGTAFVNNNAQTCLRLEELYDTTIKLRLYLGSYQAQMFLKFANHFLIVGGRR